EEIAWRCVLPMISESVRCLEEGILRSARDGDIGAVMGLGFPPFRGGPFRMVDRVGPREITQRLKELQSRLGTRFGASPMLLKMAESRGRFYEAPPGHTRPTLGSVEEQRAGT